MLADVSIYLIIKQIWNQLLLVAKATALKQQIAKFYQQMEPQTLAITFMSVTFTGLLQNVKASFYA